jgi:DNA-directed RNA polymerase subunit M/transcription elongation factor TFIIS
VEQPRLVKFSIKKAEANRAKLAIVNALGLNIHRGEDHPRWRGGRRQRGDHPCPKCGALRICEGRHAELPCRKCYYAERAEEKVNGRAKYKERARLKMLHRASDNKARAIERLGGRCAQCGTVDLPLCCYHFHHKDRRIKAFNVGQMLRQAWSVRLLQEIDKCLLLCANCHAIVTWKEQAALGCR